MTATASRAGGGAGWPRSLFGRNLLLMAALILGAQLATGLVFRQQVVVPRLKGAADATVRNVQAFEQALRGLPPAERAAFVDRFNAREDAGGRHGTAAGPASAATVPLTRLERALLARIGRQLPPPPGSTGPRWRRGPGDSLVIRVDMDGQAYWLDLRGMLPANDVGGAWLAASLASALLAIAGAWWLQRRIDRPMNRLVDGARRLEQGAPAAPLPEDGPAEIAALSRAFNEMSAGLARNARERDVMLAGLSHDLRTPLAKMRLAVEMIGPGADAELMGTLQRNVDAIDGLVTQFVAFTRATQAPDEAPREIDLDTLVGDALTLCPPEGVRFAPGGAGPRRLRPSAVARIVLNLVTNAQRHGAPPVEVRTGHDAGGAWLEVRDHGPGIPPGRVEALMAPFARGDEARGGTAGGAGLGLAIVDRLARAEGGRLALQPAEGGGLAARVHFRAG